MTVLCSVCGERLEEVGTMDYLHYPSLPKTHQPAPYTLVGDEQLIDPPAILRRDPYFKYLKVDEAFYSGLGAKLEARLNAFLARYPKEVDE